jgi:hypothetical protein
MSTLIKFLNVSFCKDREFGIDGVDLDIQKRKKYLITLPTAEKLATLLGLMEGRYHPNSGVVHRYERTFIQSDRLLLGGKVYDKNVADFLKLKDDHFFFDDKRRTKQNFLLDLKARHIRHFPIYKLKGEDRLKFALLAMTFQESGMILISELLHTKLEPNLQDHLNRIITGTRCTLCLLTAVDQDTGKLEELLKETSVERIDLL